MDAHLPRDDDSNTEEIASLVSSNEIDDEEAELSTLHNAQEPSRVGQKHADELKRRAREHRVSSKRALRKFQSLYNKRQKVFALAWEAFYHAVHHE